MFREIDVLKDEFFNELNITSNGDNKHVFKEKVNQFCAKYTVREQLELLLYKYSQIFDQCTL